MKENIQHPVLKKVVKVEKKYNAHDEKNKYKNGDKVSIIESKPFSKNKKFQVMEKKIMIQVQTELLLLIILEQKKLNV